MKTKGIAASALLAATLLQATHAFGHHSISMIEISTPIWVKGTVTQFQVVHPHVLISMDVPASDGQVQHWTIEGPNLMRLERMHADDGFLKPGEAIEVCGFPLKKSVMSTRTNFVHGHLLVMPDGQRRLFGPYGKLDNCVRPGDTAATWLTFLTADPLGLQAWCAGLTYTRVPSVASDDLVKDINQGLPQSCR